MSNESTSGKRVLINSVIYSCCGILQKCFSFFLLPLYTAYLTTEDYGLILNIIDTMPMANVILVIAVLCMIAFYATSFDSIAYTAACYSYKELGENEHPHKLIELLWCILLIILPIALVFSESSMNNIQSISIISAFPIGIIMIVMIMSFFKDLKTYIIEKNRDDEKANK